jgi:hypothetical protein
MNIGLSGEKNYLKISRLLTEKRREKETRKLENFCKHLRQPSFAALDYQSCIIIVVLCLSIQQAFRRLEKIMLRDMKCSPKIIKK